MPYVTDGSIYAQALGAEVVLLGPGEARLAHQADESVDLAALDAAAEAYATIAERLLA